MRFAITLAAADGGLFYVMPLLPGGSLEDWPRPVPEDRVIALLDSLLDALAHAHAAEIIHRTAPLLGLRPVAPPEASETLTETLKAPMLRMGV